MGWVGEGWGAVGLGRRCRKVQRECVSPNRLRHGCFINKPINSVDKINMSIVRSNISNLLVINVNTPCFLLSSFSSQTRCLCSEAASASVTFSCAQLYTRLYLVIFLQAHNRRILSAASLFTFDLLIHYAFMNVCGFFFFFPTLCQYGRSAQQQ